jgi:hypothetical protein
MDLGAFVQIDDLSVSEIVKKNGIEVPRLRGYRLMKYEEPIPKEDYDKVIKRMSIWECKELIENTLNHIDIFASPFNQIKRKTNDETEIRWDLIHGKMRKKLKLAIKHRTKRVKAQFDMFNKYAGKEGILMIHSRTGGDNWYYYGCNHEVESKPWFLEKVDDYFDGTYCDIYAKIDLNK